MEYCKVNLQTESGTESFEIRKGLGLQALVRQTSMIEYDCKKADCGICIVEVTAGAENLSPPTEAEADFLKAMHADAFERLACQCRVFGDVSLAVDENKPL
jgi:ferredoxin